MLRPVIRALLFTGTLAALLVFARLATLARPVDLVEAAALTRATQFAQGPSAYPEPSRLDEPAMMPGLPLVVTPLVRAFGPDVGEPRAIALTCIAVLALLVLAIVRFETASWTLAVTSVGFLVLGMNLLASPPGLARPELLMLVFIAPAFLALRLSDDLGGPLVAALLFAAAFFCSPQALWYVAAAMFALWIDSRNRMLVFTVVLGLLVGGVYVLLSGTLGPWFNAAVWGRPLAGLHWSAEAPLAYVGGDLLGRLGVLTLAAVLSFALPTAPWKGKGGLWMCMGVAAVASALVATQTKDYGPDTLVPTLVALAILGPLSMQRVTGHLSSWPGASRMGGQGVVLAALVLQFLMFFASAQEAWRTSF